MIDTKILAQAPRAAAGVFALQCPICASAVEVEANTGLCQLNGHRFRRANGIWRFLPLAREVEYRDFMRDYRVVRAAEGWGAANASYYRALPRVARNDPQHDIWNIRAKNFSRLLGLIGNATNLKILDIGAGNGWLSNQLAQRGHTLAALDLSDDERDGLGAWKNYEARFECYQAEFDRLPFRGTQFDLAIFNAALHYSHDLMPTLAEAKRVIKANGKIIALDSPFYLNPSDGAVMVEAREAEFAKKFGLTRRVETIGFLTPRELQRGASEIGLRLQVLDSREDWKAQLRRMWSERRVGRASARFPLIVFER